jgi:hypothetical protein
MQRAGHQSLPSSDSVNAVLRREPGGWTKVLVSTALRAVLIAPGMAVVGARGWKLPAGALLSSATITFFLFIFYGAKVDGSQPVPTPISPSES